MDRKVRFPGHGVFWFLQNDEDGSGPLAPLEHCTDTGGLYIYSGLMGESYAHVGTDGNIRRYRNVIGNVKDLLDLKEQP